LGSDGVSFDLLAILCAISATTDNVTLTSFKLKLKMDLENIFEIDKPKLEELVMMNTASKLGPHTQTDRGTCPGVGL
jgi:hypothetical protein